MSSRDDAKESVGKTSSNCVAQLAEQVDAEREPTPSLSLGTCGLKVTHAIGVSQYVYQRFVHEDVRVVATSGGCYPAVCLASGVEPHAWFERDYGPYCLGRWNARRLGLFWDDVVHLRRLFARLPPAAALAADGRLVVAVTPLPFPQRWVGVVLLALLRLIDMATALLARVVDARRLPAALAKTRTPRVVTRSTFADVDDLVDACMCSMHIPALFANPTPAMTRYVDGGFGAGGGAPRLDANTVTVQPDAGSDVPSLRAPTWAAVLALENLRPQATVDRARRECALGFEAARAKDALFLRRGFAVRAGVAADPAAAANPWGARLA